jgi:hypothetical protein
MLLLAIAIAAVVAMSTNTASAQCNGRGYGYGYGYGQRASYSGYRIPYFSLHPPVYYGERVRLNYGDSPFVQRAGRNHRPLTSSAIAPAASVTQPSARPFMVYNQHMNKPQVVSQQPAAQNSRGPQMIYNPFFKKEESPASEYIARD